MHFYGDDHLGSRRLVCRIQPRLFCSIEKTSCEPGSLNGDLRKLSLKNALTRIYSSRPKHLTSLHAAVVEDLHTDQVLILFFDAISL